MNRNEQPSRKPLHVMHVLGNLGPGGAEMGVIRLIQAFPGEDVTHSLCILGDDLRLRDELGDAAPCHVMGFKGKVRSAFWPLARLFRQQGVDIVHVNNLAPWLDAALASSLAGCRCLQTFHGVEQAQLRFSPLRRALLRLAACLSDGMTAVAAPAADLMADLTGITRNRIRVIDNGIDTDVFTPVASRDEKKQLRRNLDLPETGILIGCVAALRPVKNHQGLIEAFARTLDANVGEAFLVLVGDGPLEGELRQKCQDLGPHVAERVLFLGRRTDIARLLPALDVFVLNSDTEGLSYAVLEAMACGLPVVATEVGANPQLITQARQGVLVPFGDAAALARALCEVVGNPAQSEIMGANARCRAEEEFSLRRMSAAFRDLYLNLVSRSK